MLRAGAHTYTDQPADKTVSHSIYDGTQRDEQMEQSQAQTNLERLEPWHGHEDAGGRNLSRVLPHRVRTGPSTEPVKRVRGIDPPG